MSNPFALNPEDAPAKDDKPSSEPSAVIDLDAVPEQQSYTSDMENHIESSQPAEESEEDDEFCFKDQLTKPTNAQTATGIHFRICCRPKQEDLLNDETFLDHECTPGDLLQHI